MVRPTIPDNRLPRARVALEILSLFFFSRGTSGYIEYRHALLLFRAFLEKTIPRANRTNKAIAFHRVFGCLVEYCDCVTNNSLMASVSIPKGMLWLLSVDDTKVDNIYLQYNL